MVLKTGTITSKQAMLNDSWFTLTSIYIDVEIPRSAPWNNFQKHHNNKEKQVTFNKFFT